MKQAIRLFVATIFLMSSPAVAAQDFNGKCIYTDKENTESKFRSCLISKKEADLELIFKSDKLQDGNRKISGSSIIQIASGNYAKRLLSDTGSLIGRVLFSPVGLISGIFKRDYQEYVLDYRQEGQPTATVIRVDIKDAPEFQQGLRLISGEKLIKFEPPTRSNTIQLGPDIK